jgi:sRNA-binding protein
MTIDAVSPTNKKADQRRGFKEGAQQFELLRARWPRAFPVKPHEVRPLTNGAQQALVEAFGWSLDYARGVLAMWKTQPAYCRAILFYTKRINLDGSASGEEVGDTPRAMAKERLEQIAVRRAKKAEQKLRAATEGSAQPQAPELTPAAIADVKSETAAPVEPPKPRKLVVAGSAAMEAALKRRLASGAVTTEVVKIVPTPAPARKREQNRR